MKIVCTKEEMSELVARCHEKPDCSGCIMENMCRMYEQDASIKAYQRLVEMVEIRRRTQAGAEATGGEGDAQEAKSCETCAHVGWDMPQCRECLEYDYKWWESKK